MKHKAQSALKKHLLLFTVVSSLFSSISFAALTAPQVLPATPSINTAPPSFPTAAQAFKKIYSGDLSLSDAQTQPWFESYDRLYRQTNNNASDPNITALLTNLQQQVITSDAADTQFQAAQATLKASADSVFSS